MNRKEQLMAAIFVGTGLGYRIDSYDMEDVYDDLHAHAAKYTPLAIALVETAADVALAYPDNYLRSCFDNFGDWIGEEANDNGDTVPDHEATIKWLVDNVMVEFSPLLDESQLKSLRTRLQETADTFVFQ